MLITPDSPPSALDLTGKAALFLNSAALRRATIARASQDTLLAIARTDAPRERARDIAETFRKLEITEGVELLRTAGKSSLSLEPAGLRVLFGFLEVKRPGGEVLRQLEGVRSLERMALQLVGGRWPRSSEAEKAAFAIIEALEEGTRVGIIDLALDTLPRNPRAVSGLMHHLRTWFRGVRADLEAGGRVPEETMQYLTHLALVEIHCLEDRLFRLAGRVDPYDGSRIARLLPLISTYDQDIEHMKDVVSRLATYQPFYERRMTVEHAISPEETDRLGQALARDPSTAGIATVLEALRRNPLLDRPLAALVAVTHEMALRRTAVLRGTSAPDLHSILLGVLEHAREGTPLCIRVEAEALDYLDTSLKDRGWSRSGPNLVEVHLPEEEMHGFLQPDGLPRFGAPDVSTRSLSLKDLVRSQLRNDAFILGLLENARVTSVPGVVEIVAGQSRSLKVLDKITRTPSLFTGPANKNVALHLLTNPARMPLNSLRRFMNVRFVSKVDLQQMTRNKGGIRPEVAQEIDRYLRTLKSK